MPSSAPPPRPSTAGERQKLIAEYEESKRSENARQADVAVSAERRKRGRRMVLLGGIVVVAGYLMARPPAWLLPAPIPVPSPAEQEASGRFAIYLQAQQIEHFRQTTGRLPGSLDEAGEPLPGIDYVVTGPASYALQSAHDSTLRYTSTDSLAAFLGGSMTLLGSDHP
jgi:hypothetical protein